MYSTWHFLLSDQHEPDGLARLLDDVHGVVHVAGALVVDRDDLVVLLDPEPSGLAAGDNARNKDASLLLLVLVQPAVDEGEAEAPVATLHLDDPWPHG